jgi:hypothetical protein
MSSDHYGMPCWTGPETVPDILAHAGPWRRSFGPYYRGIDRVEVFGLVDLKFEGVASELPHLGYRGALGTFAF